MCSYTGGATYRYLPESVPDERKDTDMKPPASEYVTLVEVLELTSSFESSGCRHPGGSPTTRSRRDRRACEFAVLRRSGSDRGGRHPHLRRSQQGHRDIDMITGWEEFERFFGTIKPIDVRVYGKLSAEAEEWVRQFGVVSKTFEDHVAGFVRGTSE